MQIPFDVRQRVTAHRVAVADILTELLHLRQAALGGHFQIDPVKAPFVLNAFKMYDEGSTMSQIRDYLNGHNVCNNRGGQHTINSVAKILKNRRYIGEYSYRDVVIPNGIPAIVPEDLFERVQEKNREKQENSYDLGGMLLFYCSCQHIFTQRSIIWPLTWLFRQLPWGGFLRLEKWAALCYDRKKSSKGERLCFRKPF